MVRVALMVVMLVTAVAWAEPPDGPPRPGAPPGAGARHDNVRDRDGDHDRGGDRDRDRDRLSPEELQDALAVLDRVDPEAASRLRARLGEDGDHRRIANELRARIPRLEWFLKLKKWDREMFDLRVEDLRLTHQTVQLARQVRRAERGEDEAADAKALRDQLAMRLEEHFTIRQQIRERELAHLERRIEQLREELDEREDEQDELIEQRMAELLRDEGKSDW